MRPIAFIPARLGSTRLPRKPLADLNGEPMIVAVWRRAIEADIAPVWVATDAEEVAEAIRSRGGQAVLTGTHHPSGSDRICDALRRIDGDRRFDVVINIQGDLPTVAPETIRSATMLLDDEQTAIGTPVAEIFEEEQFSSPHVVKMIGTPTGEGRFRALYFTRSAAPWGDGPRYHHIGLYAWRRSALEEFVSKPPSPLEVREKLEQLRALESGMQISAALVSEVPIGVDTPDDLERARQMLSDQAPGSGQQI